MPGWCLSEVNSYICWILRKDKCLKTNKEQMPCCPYHPSICVLIKHCKHCTGSYYNSCAHHWFFQTWVQLHFCWTLKSKGLLGSSAPQEQQFSLPSGEKSQHLSNLWAHIFLWCSSLTIKCSYQSFPKGIRNWSSECSWEAQNAIANANQWRRHK